MQNSATPNVKKKKISAQVFPTEEETQVAQILGLEGVGQVNKNKIRHFNNNTRLLQQIYLQYFSLCLTGVCIRVKLFIGKCGQDIRLE